MAGPIYGQGYAPGVAMTTTPPGVAAQGGGLLGDLATVVEGAADIFRGVKGMPLRFQPANQRRMAAQALGQYLMDRDKRADEAKEAEEATPEEPKGDFEKVGEDFLRKGMQEKFAELFANPEVLLSFPEAFEATKGNLF
jgi:hypothetical protein